MKKKLFECIDGSNKFSLINEEHEETNLANSEEAREVAIGKKILDEIRNSETLGIRPTRTFAKIKLLAQELIKMHTKP